MQTKKICILISSFTLVFPSIAMEAPELDPGTKSELKKLFNLQKSKSNYKHYGIASASILGILGVGYYAYNKLNNKKDTHVNPIDNNINNILDSTGVMEEQNNNLNLNVNNDNDNDFYNSLNDLQKPELNFTQKERNTSILNKFKDLTFDELTIHFINTLSDKQWKIKNIDQILEKILLNPLILNSKDLSNFTNTLNDEQNIIKNLIIKQFIFRELNINETN